MINPKALLAVEVQGGDFVVTDNWKELLKITKCYLKPSNLSSFCTYRLGALVAWSSDAFS